MACLILIFLGMPIHIVTATIGMLGIFWWRGSTAGWTVVQVFTEYTLNSFTLAIIPLFILMGLILSYSGVGEEIFTAMRLWVGHFRGGLAVATTAACAAMGTCTGSSQATAAVMAKMAYPVMRRYGYHPDLALGVVAASGTIAAMIPPSITIVLFGVLASLRIGPVLIAGFTGGVVSALIYMIMIVGRIKLNPSLAPPSPPAPWRLRLISLRYLIPPIVMFFIIIGGMWKGVFTPTEAGGMAASVSFVIALVLRRLTWSRLREAVLETCRITLLIMLMFLGITFLTRFLIYTDVILAFANLALSFPSPLITLFLILVVYLILGMFLGTLGMLMITTPVFVPAIISLGYSGIWFGIIAIKMCEIAWITPPVALNVYIVQTTTGELSIEQAFRAILPFLACDIFTLILFIAFPQIITFLPKMMRA